MLLKHIIAHIAFWLVLMLTYAASEWGYRNNFQEAMVFEFLYLPIRMIAVYVNWYVLIPIFLYKNKIWGYLFNLLGLLFLLAIAQRFLNVYWGYLKTTEIFNLIYSKSKLPVKNVSIAC